MADSQLYCWLVKKGQVRLWREGDAVVLETDPEGADRCELTTDDALELATILYHIAMRSDGY